MRHPPIITVAVVVTLAAGILDTRLTVRAQPAGKVFRVGFLTLNRAGTENPSWDTLRHKLRELGYVEGRNLVFEGRWAEGDPARLPGLAAELVRASVDVIVTQSTAATGAAMQATTTIPIVFYVVGSPVERKIVASLARAGGNVTGLSNDVGPQIWAKRLELLKEAVPRLARVAFLLDSSFEEAPGYWKALQDAARVLNVTVVRFETAVASDFDSAFGAIGRLRPDALLQSGGSFHAAHRARIIDFASRSRLPAMYNIEVFVRDGGLMVYAPSSHALAARAAIYVDKILRGAWPGDLPVERPTTFELIINLKTARALGLTIPQSVLSRADEVIR